MNSGTRPKDPPAVGIGGVTNSDLAKPAVAAKAASSHETMDGHPHLGKGHARPHGKSKAGDGIKKVCCACGKNVAGEERFKDRQGFYWCMDCGVQENRAKHTIGRAAEPVKCADCTRTFPADQMVERDRGRVCPECAATHEKRAAREAAREAARKAAVAEEALAAERRRRVMLIGSAVAAVMAVGWAVYALVL